MKLGRPTKMTPDTVKKLEEAFALGCTDVEACLYADISRETLNNYQHKNPAFLDRKNMLKEKPVLKARKKVESELENDTNTAKWYLERKQKKEFASQHNVKHEGSLDINLLSEEDIDKEIAELETIEGPENTQAGTETGKG